jgi:hypothetical protein
VRRLLGRPERLEEAAARGARTEREEEARAEPERGADARVQSELARGGLEHVAVGRREVVLDVLLGERGQVRAGVRAEKGERVEGHGFGEEGGRLETMLDGGEWERKRRKTGERVTYGSTSWA